MAQANKKTYEFSPFGVAVHPWLNKPDVKFNADGVYKTGLRLTGTDAIETRDRVKAASDAYFEETTAEMTPAERKKWSVYYPYEEEEDDQGNPTGAIVFDFKQNAIIKLRSGEVKDIQIALEDAKNNDMHSPIWGGSVIRTMFSMRGIKMTSGKQAGVRLDFAAVQVKELSKGSGGGGRGFDVVEGFEETEAGDFPAASAGASGSSADGDY